MSPIASTYLGYILDFGNGEVTLLDDALQVLEALDVMVPTSNTQATGTLVGLVMSMTNWKEGQKDFLEHFSLNQPGQVGDDVRIFIFPPAVVQLQVQDRREVPVLRLYTLQSPLKTFDSQVGVTGNTCLRRDVHVTPSPMNNVNHEVGFQAVLT